MKKDVIWGYLSQFLQYGAALLLLPLLLRKLSSAELGIWYVFMTISALVTMLDMGFTPSLARNVSYVLGGAKQLLKNGYEVVEPQGQVDYGLLKAIIAASRKIFLWIAVGALLLLIVPGSVYILRIANGQVDQQTVLFSWGIFVFATVLNLYYKYYTPLLQGRGLYAEFYKSSALANIGFIAVTAVLLQAGFGLLAVVLGFLTSALVGRWLSWLYFYDVAFKTKLEKSQNSSVSSTKIFGILWHNAWRLGLGVIGGFLILRANTLLASAYLGLATTATYALTLQIFSAIQSLSLVAFNVQQPKLAQFRVASKKTEFLKTVELGLGFSLGIFILCSVMIVSIGTPLIQWIGGRTELLPAPLMAWIGLMLLLELNHSLAAGVIVSGNRVPFVKPAIISGVAIVLISWLGMAHGDYGLPWLIGAQFFVQLAYNNWKWPWYLAIEQEKNYFSILKSASENFLSRIIFFK